MAASVMSQAYAPSLASRHSAVGIEQPTIGNHDNSRGLKDNASLFHFLQAFFKYDMKSRSGRVTIAIPKRGIQPHHLARYLDIQVPGARLSDKASRHCRIDTHAAPIIPIITATCLVPGSGA